MAGLVRLDAYFQQKTTREIGFHALKDTKIRFIRAVKGVAVILGSLKASRAVVCHRVGCYLHLHLMSVFIVISAGILQ